MADPLPRPSDFFVLPLDDGIEWLVKDLLVPNMRPFFRALQWPVDQILGGFEAALLAVPFLVFVAVACVLAWRVAGRNIAIFTGVRSEEHTSELQSLMRISYAVFCLKKKTH